MHTQVIISLVAIAIAAAVALACDYLRARNAQLRQTVEQLKARKTAAGPARRSVPGPVAPTRAGRRSDRVLSNPGRETPQAVAAEPVKSTPVLSAWMIEQAVARAARKAAAEAIVEPTSEPTIPELPADSAEGQLWAPAADQRLELIQGSGPAHRLANVDLEVPAGMHPPATLLQLTGSCQLFNGVVISIRVTPKDARASLNEDSAHSLVALVAGLLRNADFGCRVTDQEFLLICPGANAAEAQRHLTHVSERLWDYQLRSLGQMPLVFSLGGVDVQHESLSGALASARERMNHTRRKDTASPLRLVAQRRKAV